MSTSPSLLAQRLATIRILMDQLETTNEDTLGPEHAPTVLRLRAEMRAAMQLIQSSGSYRAVHFACVTARFLLRMGHLPIKILHAAPTAPPGVRV